MKNKTGIMIVILTILLIALITALGKVFGSKDKSSIDKLLNNLFLKERNIMNKEVNKWTP